MPVEYLSAEQEARYGRFATEPSPGELEQFFRLDTRALELARAKRRSATRLGWAVQWGTVRMLGTFLTEDPTAVPASVVRFVAEQLGLDDVHFAEYGTRADGVRTRVGDPRHLRLPGLRGRGGGAAEVSGGAGVVVAGGAAGPVRPGGGVAGEQSGAAAGCDVAGPDGGRAPSGGERSAARRAVRGGALRAADRDGPAAGGAGEEAGVGAGAAAAGPDAGVWQGYGTGPGPRFARCGAWGPARWMPDGFRPRG